MTQVKVELIFKRRRNFTPMMIQLTTPCEIPISIHKIEIQKPVVLIGSCFADHIGNRMIADKWNTCINPNGIVFDPFHVFESLFQCLENGPINQSRIIHHNGLWYSKDHHGRFSAMDKDALVHQIKSERQCAHEAIQKSNWIILTFGTAWIYEDIYDQMPVANCHQIPQAQFKKRLLSIEEIVRKAKSILAHKLLQGKKVILTVSPVRYLRDTMIGNTQSKAVLHTAVHELCAQNEQLHYFPAYEIVIDELRDYRFYKEDMMHPSQQAIEYVYNKFADTFFSEQTKEIIIKLREIVNAVKHKPIHPNSEQYLQFKSKYAQKIIELSNAYPFVDFKNEKYFLSEEKFL